MQIHLRPDGQADNQPGGQQGNQPGSQADITVDYSGEGPLSRAIWLSGKLPPQPLCGGIGRCGKCRVRFVSPAPAPLDEETDLLGDEAIAEGWRLACRCQIPDSGDIVLALPRERLAGRQTQTGQTARTSQAAQPVQARRQPGCQPAHQPEHQSGHQPEHQPEQACQAGDSASADFCVWGVDLGTTSLAWRAVRVRDKAVLCEGQALNPQAGAGADVISRVAMATRLQGCALLADLVTDFLRGRLAEVSCTAQGMVIAANTAMSSILLRRDVTGLARAPYRSALQGHETCVLPGLPPVYIPPQPAPFVGGDITAGLIALLQAGTPQPFLLADLGTNGEIALVCDTGLLLTSVPLGPALEGIGLECGALASEDVVTKVTAGPMGPACRTAAGALVTEGMPCQGISATGYLSLLDLLRRMQLMDEEGHLGPVSSAPLMPLAQRLAARIDSSAQVQRFLLPGRLWMSSRDVEEILKVKAAFSVAVASLLERAGLAAEELQTIALAGALGRHVDADMLEHLGFVPAGCGRKVRAVGNTSLEGACLLAEKPELREELAALCAGATVLAPAEEEDFYERYVRAMRFAPWEQAWK